MLCSQSHKLFPKEHSLKKNFVTKKRGGRFFGRTFFCIKINGSSNFEVKKKVLNASSLTSLHGEIYLHGALLNLANLFS